MYCFQRFDVFAKSFRPLGDEIRVVQFFFDDDMGHRLENGHIRARFLPQPVRGKIGHPNLARIDDNEFGPIFTHRPFEEVGNDRMGFGRVGAGDDEDVQVFHLGDGVGHGAGSQRQLQAGHRASMAKAGAMIDVVGSQQRAHHLLEEVGVFVGRFGAGVGGDGVAALIFDDAHQFVGHQIQRFIPTGFPPDGFGAAPFLPIGADERRFDPAGMIDIIRPKPAFDAQHAVVGRGVKRRFDGVNRAVFEVQIHLAAHPAVRTGCLYYFIGGYHN